MQLITRALCLAVAACSSVAAYGRNERIFQAFDETFTKVETRLDALKAEGFTAVQVSPPTKSAAGSTWYLRYQPIDLRVIEGPLGNETQLRHLIATAHAKGIKVLVDTVLNHMADVKYVGGQLRYPEFSENDFHFADGQHCIQNYNNRTEVTTYWLCDQNANLPDLNTSSAYVRGVHKKFLKKMTDMGIDGFRFDAVKHVEREYWADVLKAIPAGKYYYGEVIGETIAESNIYTGLMPVTDFHMLRTMLAAFSNNGDMRSLTNPEAFGAALPGSVAVVFARNHDTAMHSTFFNFGDAQDAQLANAFVIARGVGDILVYRDDGDKPLTKGAMAFDKALRSTLPFVRDAASVCAGGCDPRTTLFVERGGKGIMILNTANFFVNAGTARMPGLDVGCYKETQGTLRMSVTKGGDGQKAVSAWGSNARGGFNIGPRSALFLVKTSDQACQF